MTIAFVGYDGGRIAAEGLADHVVVTRSQHIPRIQEAQASAYHVLRELIELAGRSDGRRRRHGERAAGGSGARVSGTVQGVGFRPFVFRLAEELGARAAGCSTTSAVSLLEVEGEPAAVEAFLDRLRDGGAAAGGGRGGRAPSELARHAARTASGSSSRAARASPTAPGLARHGDLRGLPGRALRPRRPPPPLPVHQLHQLRPAVHDRPRRPLRPAADDDGRLRDVRALPGRVRGPARPPLPRPAECLPALRPAARLLERRRRRAAASGATATRSRRRPALLRAGAIVAVKGLGGYHLACRADDERAVAALRARKHREDKPFALMAPTSTPPGELVELTADEEELLAGRRAPDRASPRRRAGAPGRRRRSRPRSPDLGVMLPYSPLHHLLLADAGDAAGDDLAATSRTSRSPTATTTRCERLGADRRRSSCSTTARSTCAPTTRCVRALDPAGAAGRCCCAARAGYVPASDRACRSSARGRCSAAAPS